MARDDDFSSVTKQLLAARAGHVCSCPDCRAPTSGPQLEKDKVVTAGDAAHITAASPNGPRYDASLSSEERRKHNNGIWLCVTHARIVDQDQSRYTVEELRRWKQDAEAEAQRRLGKPQVATDEVIQAQQVNAAVVIQGPNAINISGPNAVVLGPNAIKIVGPVVHNKDSKPAEPGAAPDRGGS